jgi:ribulose-phosphate 3-epimerase
VVRSLERAGADMIHFDVEDGVFVPVMTLGTKIIGDLRPLTTLPFDVHLMMVRPEWLIPDLIESGAGRISVHYEACPYPRRTLRMIAKQGVEAGLAFNPGTPLPDLSYLRPYLHFVTLLTTEPEVPDCPFLPSVLAKLPRGAQDQELEWVVDGGLDESNIIQALHAGADTAVVGRAAFKDEGPTVNLAAVRAAIARAEREP